MPVIIFPKSFATPNLVVQVIAIKFRSGHHVSNFLDGYKGYMHLDEHKGYYDTAATLVSCWIHARRKINKALKVQNNDESGERIALTHIKSCMGKVVT